MLETELAAKILLLKNDFFSNIKLVNRLFSGDGEAVADAGDCACHLRRGARRRPAALRCRPGSQ